MSTHCDRPNAAIDVPFRTKPLDSDDVVGPCKDGFLDVPIAPDDDLCLVDRSDLGRSHR